MKETDDFLLQEFRNHPLFDDKDLIYKLLKSPVFLGYQYFVSIPTQKKLLDLFKHWYRVLLDRNFFLHYQVSSSELDYVDYVNARLSLIAKFLPKEEVEAVCKQMDEEDLKLDAEALQRVEEKIQGLSEEREVLEEAVSKQVDAEELKLQAKELQRIEEKIQHLSIDRDVLEKRERERRHHRKPGV